MMSGSEYSPAFLLLPYTAEMIGIPSATVLVETHMQIAIASSTEHFCCRRWVTRADPARQRVTRGGADAM